MPIYRTKNGKKITKLYLDEIKRLHSTKDLLADLVLNQPLVGAYAQAHGLLAEVCDLWPMPDPKERKAEAESPVPDDEPPAPRPWTTGPADVDEECESSAKINASTEAASDPRTA